MFEKHKGSKQSQPHMDEPVIKHATSAINPPPTAPQGKAGVIGPGIVIDGNISGSDNLVIEGKVKGNIQLGAHEVTIGQSGEVNADVVAKLIRVAGVVNGDLTAKEKVVISSSGNVHGNIVAPRVLLEDGAVFKGSIDMDPRDAAASQAGLASARMAAKPASAVAPEVASKGPDLALKSG